MKVNTSEDIELVKARLIKQRKMMKRDIFTWTKAFVAKNKRQPSKEDRKVLAGSMFRSYGQVTTHYIIRRYI